MVCISLTPDQKTRICFLPRATLISCHQVNITVQKKHHDVYHLRIKLIKFSESHLKSNPTLSKQTLTFQLKLFKCLQGEKFCSLLQRTATPPSECQEAAQADGGCSSSDTEGSASPAPLLNSSQRWGSSSSGHCPWCYSL